MRSRIQDQRPADPVGQRRKRHQVHAVGHGGVQDWVEAGAQGTLVVDMRISRTVVAPFILEIIEKTIKK